MQPLKIAGEDTHLEHKELTYSKGYELKDGPYIPYTKTKVKQLYDDALVESPGKKGVLLLDCTNPRVYAQGNVLEKAQKVQDMYASQGKRIVVIVTHGGEI